MSIKVEPSSFVIVARHQQEDDMIWAHLEPGQCFKEWKVTSKRNNTIDLEIKQWSNLIGAFKAAAGADELGIKLSKRDGEGVLCFDFKAGDDGPHSAVCVAVRVMTDDEADNNVEGQMPTAEFQMEVPLAQMSQVVEKFTSWRKIWRTKFSCT